MAELRLHDIPDEELAAFATHAARHGRSVEDELRHMLHEAAAEELLVTRLEQATRALDEQLSTTVTAAPPRKRYRTTEPTPRRRAK